MEVPPIFSAPRPGRRSGSRVSGTLIGAGLVAAGLGVAFLTIDPPLASRLVTGSWSGSGRLPFAAIIWFLGIVAGAALLVAGTGRLAVIVATLHSATRNTASVARALEVLPDVTVVRGVTPRDGRPVPTLVVGPFGVAVVDEMARGDRLRRVEGSWEARTRGGWIPTDHPLEAAMRDVERVRHWLMHDELDFVVRVYAALVTPDPTIPRSPLCAVITAEQVPAWVKGLPRQRTLTDGRRNVLLARVRGAVGTGGRASDR